MCRTVRLHGRRLLQGAELRRGGAGRALLVAPSALTAALWAACLVPMLSARAPRLCLLLLAFGCKRTPEIEEPNRPRGPQPTTAVMTAPPQPPAPSGDCVLSIPKNTAELPIFPTLD